jgi:hypothetical protein
MIVLIGTAAFAVGLVLGALADWPLLLQGLRRPRRPAPAVPQGMSRMELDLAAGDPELAAIARGNAQT